MNEIDQIIISNEALVRRVVRQFPVPGVDPEDLMQEGRIGLWQALQRFDPERGVSFPSYAAWWVRKYVQEALLRYGNIVRLPQHNRQAMERCVSESIDTTLYYEDDDPITYADILEDPSLRVDDRVERRMQMEQLDAAMETLTPRQQTIVRHLHGIEGADILTRQALADEMGLQPENVQKIYERSLKKLQKNAH